MIEFNSLRRSRYYFILYEVDAPIKQRFLRFREKYRKQKAVGLEEFIELDDMVRINLCFSLTKHSCHILVIEIFLLT